MSDGKSLQLSIIACVLLVICEQLLNPPFYSFIPGLEAHFYLNLHVAYISQFIGGGTGGDGGRPKPGLACKSRLSPSIHELLHNYT